MRTRACEHRDKMIASNNFYSVCVHVLLCVHLVCPTLVFHKPFQQACIATLVGSATLQQWLWHSAAALEVTRLIPAMAVAFRWRRNEKNACIIREGGENLEPMVCLILQIWFCQVKPQCVISTLSRLLSRKHSRIPECVEATNIPNYKYVPFTSVDVKHSSSTYKVILVEKRQNLDSDNLKMVHVCYCSYNFTKIL